MWSFGLLCDECCKTDELIHDCDGVGQMNSFCAKPYDAMRFVRYEEELLMLTITLLGTAATMPLPERALTAAVAECGKSDAKRS